MGKDVVETGRVKNRRGKIMQTVALILGIVFIIYFLCIEFFTGHGTNFYYIWLFLGMLLLGYWFAGYKNWIEMLPVWLRRGTLVCFVTGIFWFVIVEGLIISGFNEKGEERLDYIIVLGAQLKPTGPSKVLQMRLDTAYSYLIKNPNTRVIVSGGQGNNEPDTEAQGMYEYLVKLGVEEERIIKEDKSFNTLQNILYSSEFLDKENSTVGIVSNNFHIFRATGIARAKGYKRVCGIAAPSYAFLQPNNMLREFFGVVKDFLFGNM